MAYIDVNKINLSKWMDELFDELKNKTLAQISMPGSHDAAMSRAANCTIGADATNTKTQSKNIQDQLNAGFRYFDLRPIFVKKNGGYEFATGHFSEVGPLNYQGCFGESLSSIVKALNGFLAANSREFLILDFGHYLQKSGDTITSYDGPPAPLVDYICRELSPYLHKPGAYYKPFSEYTLYELISGGRVIARYSGLDKNDLDRGAYNSSFLNIYDEYSGSNNLDSMKKDQWRKFNKLNNFRRDNYRLLLTEKSKREESSIYSNLCCIEIASSTFNLPILGVITVPNKKYYIAGLNQDKFFFMGEVSEGGTLSKESVITQKWENYYQFFGHYHSEGKTYFYGVSNDASKFFISPLSPTGLGNEIFNCTLKHKCDSFVAYSIGSRSFFATQEKVNNEMHVYELEPAGKGMSCKYSETLDRFYTTLTHFNYDGKTYLAGQSIDKVFFMTESYDNGKIKSLYAYHRYWGNYYYTLISFEQQGHVFLMGQREDKAFYIDEVVPDVQNDGKLSTELLGLSNEDHVYPGLGILNINGKVFRVKQACTSKVITCDRIQLINQFLLSWTLTQSDSQAATSNRKATTVAGSVFGLAGIAVGNLVSTVVDSIENLADRANDNLASELNEKVNNNTITPAKLPNIVYVDYSSEGLSREIIKLNLAQTYKK